MNDLEFAIKMELDGEKYYRKQAEYNKDNSLRIVCEMMADEEKMHAKVLSELLNKQAFELKEADILADAQNIFADLSDVRSSESHQLGQLDFYEITLEMERESINLYTEYLGKAADVKERELLEFLIRQEEKHVQLLEEMVKLVGHAEDWVESPEFGNREEY